MSNDLERAARGLLTLLNVQKLFGPSHDGAVERDIEVAKQRLLAACNCSPAQPEGWVSVEDRLPEARTRVLFVSSDYPREVFIGWKDDEDLSYGSWCDSEEQDMNGNHVPRYEVTHWMPLPAPPRAEGEQSAAPAGADTLPEEFPTAARLANATGTYGYQKPYLEREAVQLFFRVSRLQAELAEAREQLQQHQRFLDDWLQRLEAVHESEAAKGKPC